MKEIEKTKDWVKNFVIGLNLCPFAAHPFSKNKIRYRLEETKDVEFLVATLMEELQLLHRTSPEEIETSLIIHPHVLNNFLDYNDFLAVAENVLQELDLEGVIQVASFHPNYQFANTRADDPTNFVTRSPFPMLHLLREDSVSRAVDTHPNTEEIPLDNMETLRELGIEGIRKILD